MFFHDESKCSCDGIKVSTNSFFPFCPFFFSRNFLFGVSPLQDRRWNASLSLTEFAKTLRPGRRDRKTKESGSFANHKMVTKTVIEFTHEFWCVPSKEKSHQTYRWYPLSMILFLWPYMPEFLRNVDFIFWYKFHMVLVLFLIVLRVRMVLRFWIAMKNGLQFFIAYYSVQIIYQFSSFYSSHFQIYWWKAPKLVALMERNERLRKA